MKGALISLTLTVLLLLTSCTTPSEDTATTTTAVTTTSQITVVTTSPVVEAPPQTGYRPDLIWGQHHLPDDVIFGIGIMWIDALNQSNAKANNLPTDQLYAVSVQISVNSDKSAEDYFASLGWEILPRDMQSTYLESPAKEMLLVAATHEQLWAVTTEDLAAYFQCDAKEIAVSFIQAVQPEQS